MMRDSTVVRREEDARESTASWCVVSRDRGCRRPHRKRATSTVAV
jgi:hypothetical protein